MRLLIEGLIHYLSVQGFQCAQILTRMVQFQLWLRHGELGSFNDIISRLRLISLQMFVPVSLQPLCIIFRFTIAISIILE